MKLFVISVYSQKGTFFVKILRKKEDEDENLTGPSTASSLQAE